MPNFSELPTKDVMPVAKNRSKGPSFREETAALYRQQVSQTLERGVALVVDLEPDEKPLTIRKRILRAIASEGYKNVAIRRRGNRIVAYVPIPDESASDLSDGSVTTETIVTEEAVPAQSSPWTVEASRTQGEYAH